MIKKESEEVKKKNIGRERERERKRVKRRR